MTFDPCQCKCTSCKMGREYDALVKARDFDKLAEFTSNLMDSWLAEAEDANYYRCVFNGSWPDAIEVLEGCLAWLRVRKGTVDA